MLNLYHKKMDIWNVALSFVKEIYQITEKLPLTEKYGLTSQLRKAAVSTCSNFAEGWARKSIREKKRFLEISRASLVETDALIEISVQLGIMEKGDLVTLEKILPRLFAMVSSLIKNIR